MEAERIAKEIELIRGMEEKYPGLLDILKEPYGSLYLKEGMYQAALQFLEERVEENGGEVWILELYSDRSLENILIASCLEKLLQVCGARSENLVIELLNVMGKKKGMESGWDVYTLNKEMIEMLKQGCEDTAKKIETKALSRWSEEHKQLLDLYSEGFMELAYLELIYYWSMNTGQTETYKQEVKVGDTKNLEEKEIGGEEYNDTNIGEYLAKKAPEQVTPGVRYLEGQYIDDLGRVQPWKAYYDEYGRLIARTDYNAGNIAQGIPNTHYHLYK